MAPYLEACQHASDTQFYPTSINPTRAATQTPFPPATSPPTPSASPSMTPSTQPSARQAQVALVKTNDRGLGVEKALDLLEIKPTRGKEVFLKPNFNSADPFPGSTHPETLARLVQKLASDGAKDITVGDRSGMGDTRRVMEQIGIFRQAQELGYNTLVFDELDAGGWEAINLPGSHWLQGFAVPKAVLAAESIVQTCCLKTHRFGGHFTMSLKNSVGLAAKFVPGEGYNYMNELHRSPYQRAMIAEINAAYRPDLIILDAMEAFSNGGPDRGQIITPGVILAGTDRIALDAVRV